MALFSKNPLTTPDRKAERLAAQEQVFLREVDDALREDDAARLFRRYGILVGGGLVLVLVALAGWMVWANHVAGVAGQKGEALTIALDQVEAGRWDPAQASLGQIAGSGGPGYGAAARLVQAGVALERKKPDDAAKIFAAVAADPGAPQAYRDLATVRGVAAKFDALPPQQVIDRLKPLAVPGGSWFGSAGEMVAVAELKLGRKAQAAALLSAMARDKGVPASMQGRARQLALQLGGNPGDPAADTALAQ